MRGRGLCGVFLKKDPCTPKTFPNDFYCVMGCPSAQGLGTADCRQAPPRPCRHSRRTQTPPSGKVLVKLFQKLARSRASSPWRAPQSAKLPYRRFFLIDFSLRLFLAKKNRLWSAESNMRAVYAGTRFMRGLFEKRPLHPKNFPERFLLCDGVSIDSGLRYYRLPSGAAKTLLALAIKKKHTCMRFCNSPYGSF